MNNEEFTPDLFEPANGFIWDIEFDPSLRISFDDEPDFDASDEVVLVDKFGLE